MDPLIYSEGKAVARDGPQGLYKARVKESLPWIKSPLQSMKGKEFKTFYVRQEASMLELFFDLCFVANLSTFTAYHEITTSTTVAAYILFFLILWSTWFQITIFDVRFASDSVYERICKLLQFMTYVVFAAGGTYFSPGSEDSDKNYRIFQLISIVLGISRWFLAFQYSVVAFYVVPKYKQLLLPFLLIIVTFLVSGAALFATESGFKANGVSNIHILWWIVLPLESIIIVAISSFWRMLSFKETHITERLFLLTMIIIGEGVIGLTKIAGKVWPPDATPDAGVIISLLSVVVLLFLLWQSYFDCHPHGHYGTIKQQWWALSHFFLHLGYVGVVEGSNRMAIFSVSLTKLFKIQTQIDDLCNNSNTSNNLFVNTMNATVQASKIENYDPRGYDEIQTFFTDLRNTTLWPDSICVPSDENTSILDDLFYKIRDAFLKKYGIEPAQTQAFFHTFRVTYAYYFGSLCVMMVVSVIFLYIVRRQYHDRWEIMRMGWRLVIATATFGMIFLFFSGDAFILFIESPWVVVTICVLMASTILVDRICRFLGQRSFAKKFQIPAPEPDHGHRHSVAAQSIVLNDFDDRRPSPPEYGHAKTPSVDEFSRLRPTYASVGSEEATYQHDRPQSYLSSPDLMQDTQYSSTYDGSATGFYDPTRPT